MGIISESRLKDSILKGELIINGNIDRVQQCSYSFVSGRIFMAGYEMPPSDFTVMEGIKEVIVRPGEMVWISTLEQVKIPKDLAGFWWQTNSLSREGLMLINMSMVEPGYQGNLACLFVNFGNKVILIHPETVIAKLVFTEISGFVENPVEYSPTLQEYDGKLRKLSVNQPKTFLQIGDIKKNIDSSKDEAILEIDKYYKLLTEKHSSSLQKVMEGYKSELSQTREEYMKLFHEDIKKSIFGSSYVAAGAIVIITLSLFLSDWIRGKVTPDVNEVARREVESVLRDRVVSSGNPDEAATTLILKSYDDLRSRLDKLEEDKKK